MLENSVVGHTRTDSVRGGMGMGNYRNVGGLVMWIDLLWVLFWIAVIGVVVYLLEGLSDDKDVK